MPALYEALLRPAGHLPRKGGDRCHRRTNFSGVVAHIDGQGVSASSWAVERGHHTGLISPLEGEMAGRPEGRAEDHSHHLHLTLNRVSKIATTIVKSEVATMTSAM